MKCGGGVLSVERTAEIYLYNDEAIQIIVYRITKKRIHALYKVKKIMVPKKRKKTTFVFWCRNWLGPPPPGG
jgi:hypothetical protein